MIKDGTGVFYWKWDLLPGKNMRPGVSRLLKLCVLGEFYARFSQDAQVNETLRLQKASRFFLSPVDSPWLFFCVSGEIMRIGRRMHT